jgi:hypothetical protein
MVPSANSPNNQTNSVVKRVWETSVLSLQKIIPLLILLLALFLQMRYLAELRENFPDGFANQPFCGVDANAHVARASGLLAGTVPGDRTFYFIPFYPLYLSILKNLFGDSLLFPIFIQALLQLVGIAALYGLGRLVFSPLAGALAALGLATYNYYLFYLPCFDQVLMTLPFLTLAVFFLAKYDCQQKSWYLLAAGITLAAATLSRPTILMIYPVIIIWLYFILRRKKANRVSLSQTLWLLGKNAVLLLLPFLIAAAPITWHNYRITGRFILLSDNFDVNLYTGNNPDATGLDTLAHILSQPAVLRFEELFPRVENGETTLTAEVIRYITEQPADWLALTVTKTRFWFGEMDERLVSPYFPLTVSHSRTLAPLPLEWQATTIVALLGILFVRGRSWPRTILLWLVYGTLSITTILFFIQLRFRLPFAPFVILFAASVLAGAPSWYRQNSWRFWAVLIVLLLLYPIVPPLWIFILLFVGLGLWTGRRQTKAVSTRPSPRLSLLLSLLCCLYLLAIGWWLRAEALASDVSQTIDHYLGPPLAATGILGQTFQMDCDGLNRVEVTLGTFNEQHNQPVVFHLATDLSADVILFSEAFDASSVKDYQKKSFSFKPIPDSAGRTYFFFIASPASTPQNAITARGYTNTPVDRYPAGSAWGGQLGLLQQLDADFAFGAYCDLSPGQKMRMAIERIVRN